MTLSSVSGSALKCFDESDSGRSLSIKNCAYFPGIGDAVEACQIYSHHKIKDFQGFLALSVSTVIVHASPLAVTVFWSIKGSPDTENPHHSDIPLIMTLVGRPNTVTVSGEACNIIPNKDK